MNYNLEGMTKAEGHSYVTAKLNGAGCTQTVFEENALEAILNAANGTCLLYTSSKILLS